MGTLVGIMIGSVAVFVVSLIALAFCGVINSDIQSGRKKYSVFAMCVAIMVAALSIVGMFAAPVAFVGSLIAFLIKLAG